MLETVSVHPGPGWSTGIWIKRSHDCLIPVTGEAGSEPKIFPQVKLL